MFVRLICMLVSVSSAQTSNLSLSFQTSNFHPFLSLKLVIRPSSFLETSSVRLDLFTFDLLADVSGFKIMEKMSHSLHCIHFIFFLRTRESVQAFQDEERGESSSVAFSRVEPCLPTGFLHLVLGRWHVQLHLNYSYSRRASPWRNGGRTSCTCDLSMCQDKQDIAPMKDLMDTSARVLYV